MVYYIVDLKIATSGCTFLLICMYAYYFEHVPVHSLHSITLLQSHWLNFQLILTLNIEIFKGKIVVFINFKAFDPFKLFLHYV